jgi:hypothetical protein
MPDFFCNAIGFSLEAIAQRFAANRKPVCPWMPRSPAATPTHNASIRSSPVRKPHDSRQRCLPFSIQLDTI